MTEPDGPLGLVAHWEAGGSRDLRQDIDTASLTVAFADLASVVVEDLEIPGVPARLYRSATPSTSLLVWAHGGAFVMGDLDMPEANWVALALAARGVSVVSVDYRKALHGVHFPAPSDDLLTAWNWVVAHTDELGAGGSAAHLGGASAGAALAASAVLRLRDDGGIMPDSLVLCYPLVHAALPRISPRLADRLEGVDTSLVFSAQLVDEISLNYVGAPEHLADPHAFAGHGSLAAHPPTLILNSDRDSLRASGELYGRQLERAGTPVAVEFEPETTHGHLDRPYSEGAQRSIDRVARWITERVW